VLTVYSNMGCALPLMPAPAGADIVIMLDMSMGETPRDPIVRTLSAGARVAATELRLAIECPW
jgi:hypothetical protein